jgi:aspartyl/asparaginyl-tRNA synthetase
VQALLAVEEGKVSKLMVKWASGLSDESIVLVEGVVQKSPEEIKGATIKDVELIVTRVRSSAEVLLISAKLNWTDTPRVWVGG